MKRFLGFLVFLSLVATGVAVANHQGWHPRMLLSLYWEQSLSRLPEEEVPRRIQQLASMGREGIAPLVVAMASPRSDLSQAASTALHSMIVDWRELPAAESRAFVELLARELAGQCKRMQPEAQQHAAEMAVQLAAWQLDHTGDSTTLIAHCEMVVRSSPNKPKPQTNLTGDTNPSRLAKQSESDLYPLGWSPTSIPGGNVPYAQQDIPSLPDSLINPPKLKRIDPRAPPELKLEPITEPELFSEPPEELDALSDQQHSRQQVNRLARLTDLELMWRLHDPTIAVRREAETQLMTRGLSRWELSVAKQLSHPDVAQRLELARNLTRLDLDVLRWADWLSRDPHPAVQRVAKAIQQSANGVDR